MIVDASVAVKWLIEEDDSDLAETWLARDDLLAPELVYAEIGNVIAKRIRGGMMSATGAPAELMRLQKILSTVDAQPVMGRALEMALALLHPVYDCIYLALAEARGDHLLTADMHFAAKCESAGLGQFICRMDSLA